MNGKDILYGLNYIGDDLIEKAEKGQFPNEEPRETRTVPRYLLIAAIIALMLFLMGCAAAVVLHLDRMKLGEKTYMTKSYYNAYGIKIPPTEKVKGIYVLSGENSKNRMAGQ